MPSLKGEKANFSLSGTAIFKGSVYSLGLSLFFSLVAGLTYHFTALPESTLPWAAVLVLALGAGGGSLAAGRAAGSRGLLHGAAVGGVFFLAVWAAAGLFLPGQAVLHVYEKLAVALVAGGLGGVIGVGLS